MHLVIVRQFAVGFKFIISFWPLLLHHFIQVLQVLGLGLGYAPLVLYVKKKLNS